MAPPSGTGGGLSPGRGPRPWVVLTIVVAAVVALVVFSGVRDALRDAARPGSSTLPTAVAPPDPGVEPPPVRIRPEDAPPRTPGDRPQDQLAGWASAMSDELGIPQVALEAYGYAASTLEVTDPQCGMSWSLLAGIGAVESRHGRYGGASLDETGRPSIPIRGVPLDGTGDVQLIRDTDGGRLDGDSTFDRAVGPMQFIPTTWQRWGRDGDDDGVADPDDIDDAAMAAAHYVCGSGGDLRDPQQFWDALLEYNASREYVQDVLDHADHYGERSHRLAARK